MEGPPDSRLAPPEDLEGGGRLLFLSSSMSEKEKREENVFDRGGKCFCNPYCSKKEGETGGSRGERNRTIRGCGRDVLGGKGKKPGRKKSSCLLRFRVETCGKTKKKWSIVDLKKIACKI